MNFIFFVCQVIKNLQWPLEKELVVYKIFMNKEITDWHKYGRKTPREGGGGWYSSQMTIRINAAL